MTRCDYSELPADQCACDHCRPDASNHAERVRAELASIKAGLCTHGYRGCKCRDQETEPTEPSNEATGPESENDDE